MTEPTGSFLSPGLIYDLILGFEKVRVLPLLADPNFWVFINSHAVCNVWTETKQVGTAEATDEELVVAGSWPPSSATWQTQGQAGEPEALQWETGKGPGCLAGGCWHGEAVS